MISSPGEAKEVPLPQGPLSITSQRMTVKNLEQLALFEGEVVMKKGDLTIHADRAEVFFAPKESLNETSRSTAGLLEPDADLGQNSISVIHVMGNVTVEQAEKKAQSQEAYYYQNEEKVVLTGEPVIWEKDYQVKGTRMTIFLREDRSVVEGSKVMIHPKSSAPLNAP